MDRILLMQYITLCIYAFFVGFCFCDGFKLHVLGKLTWFVTFLAICMYVLRAEDQFNLSSILPVPTLFALLLCRYEKRKSKQKAV